MIRATPIYLRRMNHYAAHPLKKITHLLLWVSFVCSGCGRPTTVSPEEAFRPIEVEHIDISDDLNLEGLDVAISLQREILRKSGDTLMRFGSESILRREYAAALDALSATLKSSLPLIEKLAYIRNNFRFLEWYGGSDWGEILLTSYFEPIIPGSVKQTARFSQPLYSKPEDLVVIDLKKFSERFKDESNLRGRVHEGKVTPYFSRNDIDSGHALDGRNLELCWVDPTDAFFLHIQGSGTVKLPHGDELFITYAEKNGQRYEPIGKYLKERLAPFPVTMQRIEKVVKTMSPQERSELFAKNPSYVFFTTSKRRAITSLGVPATPGRTIAVDSKFAPKGSLALISFNKPEVDQPESSDSGMPPTTQVSRFVLDQDSGGAITGTDHVDLFWGRGDDAKKVAGILQDKARIVFLVPKR
jgi:membrane-bound lytic murein transglycosylase A